MGRLKGREELRKEPLSKIIEEAETEKQDFLRTEETEDGDNAGDEDEFFGKIDL
jgi:hypothetical protein